MRKLSLSFGPGIENEKDDCRVVFSEKGRDSVDFLIFTDSRGSAIEDFESKEYCWTDGLIKKLERDNFSYLFVSRPKDLTVFFTLLNFLELTPLKFKYLVTNMGFVDFTPKKKIYSEDILTQTPNSFNRNGLILRGHETISLSVGGKETLHSYEYLGLSKLIGAVLDARFQHSFLLSTLEVSREIVIPRKRPDSFFSQLRVTNKFLGEISSNSKACSIIDPFAPHLDESRITYDGVHFTKYGHQIIVECLIDFLIEQRVFSL